MVGASRGPLDRTIVFCAANIFQSNYAADNDDDDNIPALSWQSRSVAVAAAGRVVWPLGRRQLRRRELGGPVERGHVRWPDSNPPSTCRNSTAAGASRSILLLACTTPLPPSCQRRYDNSSVTSLYDVVVLGRRCSVDREAQSTQRTSYSKSKATKTINISDV